MRLRLNAGSSIQPWLLFVRRLKDGLSRLRPDLREFLLTAAIKELKIRGKTKVGIVSA